MNIDIPSSIQHVERIEIQVNVAIDENELYYENPDFVGVGKSARGEFVFSDSFAPCQAVVAKLGNGEHVLWHAFSAGSGQFMDGFFDKIGKEEVSEIIVFSKEKNRNNKAKAPLMAAALHVELDKRNLSVPINQIHMEDYRCIVIAENKIILANEIAYQEGINIDNKIVAIDGNHTDLDQGRQIMLKRDEVNEPRSNNDGNVERQYSRQELLARKIQNIQSDLGQACEAFTDHIDKIVKHINAKNSKGHGSAASHVLENKLQDAVLLSNDINQIKQSIKKTGNPNSLIQSIEKSKNSTSLVKSATDAAKTFKRTLSETLTKLKSLVSEFIKSAKASVKSSPLLARSEKINESAPEKNQSTKMMRK